MAASPKEGEAESRIGAVLVETYRIERLIGEGGMGSVYEATHLRLPKRFAVKFLNLSMLGNLEALLRFRREAEIVAALDHPSIVNLFDYNVTDDGVPYIVLEFLDGEHLGQRAERGKLKLAEAMRILVPVGSALGFAHARDIVHRDLKPENIIVTKTKQVKVVDFGIAKIRGGAELTAINTILGTVPYMAPEQLLGGKVDARTDQFALAAIVYEILKGEMAFGAESVPAAAARVAHFDPPAIEGIPEGVNRAIARALAKDADHRFPTVMEFVQEMVEAASRPDEGPAVIVEDVANEGLPPLAGEATAITWRAGAPAEDEEDDEVAEPPAPRGSMVITDKGSPSAMGAGGWEETTGPVTKSDPGILATGKLMMATAPTAVGPAPAKRAAGPAQPSVTVGASTKEEAQAAVKSIDVPPPPMKQIDTPLPTVMAAEAEPVAPAVGSKTATRPVAMPMGMAMDGESTALSRLPGARDSDGGTAAVTAPPREVATSLRTTWLVIVFAAIAGAGVGIWLITRH